MFPESFYSFLYNYVASLNELSSEALSGSTLPSQTGTPLQSAGPGGVNTTVRSTVSSTTTFTSTVTTTGSATTIVPGSTIGSTEVTTDLLPSDSDHRVERIWADYESVEAYITPEASVSTSASAQEGIGQTEMKTESRFKEVEAEGVKVEYVASGPNSRNGGKAFQVCDSFFRGGLG